MKRSPLFLFALLGTLAVGVGVAAESDDYYVQGFEAGMQAAKSKPGRSPQSHSKKSAKKKKKFKDPQAEEIYQLGFEAGLKNSPQRK